MADIEINPVTRRLQYTGNTGLGPFSFNFNILADGDIAVYKNTTLLTLTSEYTVSTNADGTGSITLTGTGNGTALVLADVLTIIGGRLLERTTDFVAGGDFFAASINEQLDSQVIMAQQLDEKLGRSLKVNPGDTYTDLELPLKADRLNRVLQFNASTGDPEAGPTVDDVENAQTYANNASTSATNAATSASAAASSASAAATSASNAASSETDAQTAQTAAETAQTAAETAQTAAETAETGAATSATNAASSASAAATSETNAATSATNAATSATNAASSATSAASAQTAAESARDATLLAYDNFDDRYLGAKASDPTVDNDGDALVAGALYFNTTDEEMKLYTGSAWVAAYVSGAGYLASANNLSDLASAATARTNLGLGTAATTASTAYATAAQGTNADTAFGWGNHASAGYLTNITGQSIEDLSDVSAMTPAEGQALVYSSGSWSAADMAGGIAYVRKTANYTASANEGIIADTSGGSFTVTLPASPATGDTVVIADGADWSTNNLTVGRNGSTIEGDAADMTMDLGNASVQFTYDGTTWQAYAQVGVAGDGVTLTGVQTLTNKTLTSPTITSPTITSPTITSPDIDLGSDATGDILYRNSGGAIARLGIGSTDQVLKVASGLPSWGDAGGAAGLEFIATADASNVAVLDFTAFDATKYDSYLFTLANVIPTSDNVYLYMRFSANGGSSYYTSNYAYNIVNGQSTSVLGEGSASYPYIVTSSLNIGTQANEDGVSGQFWVHGPHLTKYTRVVFTEAHTAGNGAFITSSGAGELKVATAVNALRFGFSGGNVESGTITMYGLKNA